MRSIFTVSLILYSSASFLCPPARAAVGFSLPPSALPEQVCLIRFFDAAGKLEEICSATLLAPGVLHSAGHCFHGNGFNAEGMSTLRNQVTCPNGQATSVLKVVRAAAFSEVEARKDDEKRRFDSAIVHLADEMRLPLMPFAADRSAVERLLRTAPGCAIFGYGGVDFSSADFGQLRGTLVAPSAITIKSSGLIHVKGIGGWNSGLVQGGDSGGSLACLEAGTSRWVHIAGISAMDYSYGSLTAPLFLSPELFHGLDLNPAAGAEEGRSIARLSFLRRECEAELNGIARLLERTAPERAGKLRSALASLHSESAGEALLSELKKETEKALLGAIGKELRIKPFSRIELDHSAIELAEPSQRAEFRPAKNPYSLADQSVNRFTLEKLEAGIAVGTLQLFGGSEFFSFLGCKQNVLCVPGVFRNIKVPAERLDPTPLR